jgi:hypothetical protein
MGFLIMNTSNQKFIKSNFIQGISRSLIVAILFTVSCPGQTLVDVFKDDLPLKYVKDESDLQNINFNLDYYSSLEPNLIFYYIKYLNNLLVLKIKQPDQNGLKELYKLRDIYLFRRNNWLEYQINKIESKGFIRIKTNAMVEPFEDYIEDVDISGNRIPTSNDTVQYFTYKFFTKNSELQYNPSINYYNSNLKLLDSITLSINDNLAKLSKLTEYETLNILNQILTYWYLFTNDDQMRYNFSLSKEPFELSIKVYQDEYLESSGGLASIEYFFIHSNYILFDGIFDFEDYVIPTFTEPLKYPFPAKIIQSPLFSFSLGYKFRLKEELGFLSNLQLKATYTYLKSEVEFEGANEEFYRFNYHIISGDSVESYIYYATDFDEATNNYISLQIISPVFFWYKSLFVELGLSLDYYFYKYSADVYRDDALVYRPTNSINVRTTEKRGELLVEGSDFYFTPMFLINYSPSNQWKIYTGLYWNKDFPRCSLGVGYEF